MPRYEDTALEELLLRDELRTAHRRVKQTKNKAARQFLGHEIADIENAIARNSAEAYRQERRVMRGQESDEP